MGLHDGHRARRKQQYRQRGLEGLAEHEVLELLLYYAVPRRDTNETAHRLLARFGSLGAVLRASPEELALVEGVGEGAALYLQLFEDVPRYIARSRRSDVRLDSVRACGQYALRLLAGAQREMVYQLCLDDKGKLLREYLLVQGGADSAAVSRKSVAANALLCSASGVVLLHNHPGGVALPSEADRTATLRLCESLAALDVALTDHIIVADGDYVSMRQSGYLPKMRECYDAGFSCSK